SQTRKWRNFAMHCAAVASAQIKIGTHPRRPGAVFIFVFVTVGKRTVFLIVPVPFFSAHHAFSRVAEDGELSSVTFAAFEEYEILLRIGVERAVGEELEDAAGREVHCGCGTAL